MNLVREMLADREFRPILLSGLALAVVVGVAVGSLTIGCLAGTVYFTAFTLLMTVRR